ncbi:MAG: O-antigen ligase family protein [Cyanophyceae cyanobacterium]
MVSKVVTAWAQGRSRWGAWLQAHPEPRYQRPWYFAQFGILVLPFSPAIGATFCLAATILTTVSLRKEKEKPPLLRGDRGIPQGLGPRQGSEKTREISRIPPQPLNKGGGAFFSPHPLPWILGAIALVMVLGIIGAVDQGEAALGLANFLPYFFVFWVLSRLVVGVNQLRQLAWLVVLGGGPVVGIGIGQLLGWWAGPVQILGVINWQLAAGGNPVGRLASVFEYANVTASYCVVVWTIALGLAVDVWENRDRPRPNQKLAIASLGTTLALTAAGLLLTDSRNAWALGLLMTLAWAVVIGWHWLWQGVMGVIAIILGAAFAPDAVAAPLRMIVPRFIWARLNDSLYPNRPVATLRSTQWDFAWDLSWQRPALGWGLRNFSPLYEGATQVWMGHPHNLLLMLAAESGWLATLSLFGAVGWVLARGFLVVRGLSRGDRPVALSIWLGFVSLALFHIFDVTLFDVRIGLLGWILLAGVWGLVWRRDPVPKKLTR